MNTYEYVVETLTRTVFYDVRIHLFLFLDCFTFLTFDVNNYSHM